jgi:hypothetical protein
MQLKGGNANDLGPQGLSTEAHSAQQPRQEQLRGLRCEDLLSTLLPRLLKRGDLLVIEMGLRDFYMAKLVKNDHLW